MSISGFLFDFRQYEDSYILVPNIISASLLYPVFSFALPYFGITGSPLRFVNVRVSPRQITVPMQSSGGKYKRELLCFV